MTIGDEETFDPQTCKITELALDRLDGTEGRDEHGRKGIGSKGRVWREDPATGQIYYYKPSLGKEEAPE
jgi:hypothetical protein